MRFSRPAAALVVAQSISGSGLLLNEARSNPAHAISTTPPVTATTSISLSSLAIKAADRAGLVMMCRDGLTDPVAKRRYGAIAAARPELAVGIGTDCSLVTVNP